MNIALILAGGKGIRMNNAVPKQFLDVQGKPLVIHTLTKMESNSNIDAIIVVCLKDYIEKFKQLCEKFDLKKAKWIVEGGNSRHTSIKAGIDCLLDNNIDLQSNILIHNANMPLVSQENINECFDRITEGFDVVTTVAKCNEYFLELNNDKIFVGPDRDKLVTARVPEIITLQKAIELYQETLFDEKKYESFSTAMLGLIKKMNVSYVFCDSSNIKITTESDLRILNALLSENKD